MNYSKLTEEYINWKNRNGEDEMTFGHYIHQKYEFELPSKLKEDIFLKDREPYEVYYLLSGILG